MFLLKGGFFNPLFLFKNFLVTLLKINKMQKKPKAELVGEILELKEQVKQLKTQLRYATNRPTTTNN